MTTTRGMTALVAAALIALGAGAAVAQAPAAAPKQELSDKSVTVLMEYAWAILPAIFRTPTGKVIEVDKKKSKRSEVVVPVETARDVIRAGYRSAQAQLCDMLDAQADNYEALMAREVGKKKWNDQQLLYISTLHRMTIHMAAGKLRVEEKGSDELKVILEPLEITKSTCPDDRKKQVKEAIAQYVAGAPKREAGAPPPVNVAPAASAVQPAAAKDKK